MNESPNEAAPGATKTRKPSIWSRMGGGSLMIAALIHALLLMGGVFWIIQIVHEPEKKVDFLPPGGGGQRGAEAVSAKKQKQITPVNSTKRVFAEGAQASYALPDPGEDFGEMSSLSSLGGGGMGGGAFGGAGAGGGFGKNSGPAGGLGGGGLGANIKLFGIDLNVKSIGVVFDVSGSMTPHLKKVIDELNKVAPEAPVVLHVGCGLGTERPRERIQPVTAPGDRFKKFWYLHQDRTYKDAQFWKDRDKAYDGIDLKRPLPQAEVYGLLSERKKTYFVVFEGTGFTKGALLSDQLRETEAIYWFADFADAIDPKEAEDVANTLKRRHQKLYIHALGNKGRSLSIARDLIAVPTGGSQLNTPAK